MISRSGCPGSHPHQYLKTHHPTTSPTGIFKSLSEDAWLCMEKRRKGRESLLSFNNNIYLNREMFSLYNFSSFFSSPWPSRSISLFLQFSYLSGERLVFLLTCKPAMAFKAMAEPWSTLLKDTGWRQTCCLVPYGQLAHIITLQTNYEGCVSTHCIHLL